MLRIDSIGGSIWNRIVRSDTQIASLSQFLWIVLVASLSTQLTACGGTTGGNTASSTPSSSTSVRVSRSQPPITGAPYILYTDILSGPASGGENNKGAYLSLFGKNFGGSGLGTTVKVYVNNVEVDNYRYLGDSLGRLDVQQITVQVGALGNPTPGVALPIKVVVNGVASNTDHTFTVQPGDIIFVDNVNGDDATGAVGDISRPYRHVQTSSLSAAAYGRAQAGDIIVMRGTGTAWQDVGFEGYFCRFRDKSGSAPTGAAGTGPITVMGYPGEDVFINMTRAITTKGAISGINGESFPGMGQWVTVANLRVEGGGDDGAINLQVYGDSWRVVNNEITATTAQTTARAGGIAGNGASVAYLGNRIHDVNGNGQENHGIYIDGDGSYEIGYNAIENIAGGNGFQIYANGTNGSSMTNNVTLHHNLIHDVNKHGINVADGARNGITIFDNIVYNTKVAGLRFNTNTLHGCKIYNNTFYNTNTSVNASYAAIMNDWNLPSDALDLENNIFWPHPGTAYGAGAVSGAGIVSNNLWYNGTGGYGPDASPLTGDPLFVTAGTDFHIQTGSPAVDTGAAAVAGTVDTDYDATTVRPLGVRVDVGAYELIQ